MFETVIAPLILISKVETVKVR